MQQSDAYIDPHEFGELSEAAVAIDECRSDIQLAGCNLKRLLEGLDDPVGQHFKANDVDKVVYGLSEAVGALELVFIDLCGEMERAKRARALETTAGAKKEIRCHSDLDRGGIPHSAVL